VHQYRWVLENGVYTCRTCHNAIEQDPETRARLYAVIADDYPHLWAWAESQPPLGSRPISNWQIKTILAGLQRTADTLGVSYATQKAT
jgi:hypothetical protein